MALVMLQQVRNYTMSKGYLLGQITINDKDQYKKYNSKIGGIIDEYGGKYLVKGGFRVVKEGYPSWQRDVLVEFKDIETAKLFFSSKKFKDISKFRKAGSSGFLILVNGET